MRTLYVYEGGGLTIGDHSVANETGAVVACDRIVRLKAGLFAPTLAAISMTLTANAAVPAASGVVGVS